MTGKKRIIPKGLNMNNPVCNTGVVNEQWLPNPEGIECIDAVTFNPFGIVAYQDWTPRIAYGVIHIESLRD